MMRMLGPHGFLARMFHIFDKYKASVDVVATSEVMQEHDDDDTILVHPAIKKVRRTYAAYTTVRAPLPSPLTP